MHPIPFLRPFLLVTLCVTVGIVAARGQTVIGSSGAINSGAGSGVASVRGSQILPLSGIASAFAKPGPLWQAGPFALRPHLSYEVVHSTGVLRIPGSEENTTLQTLSPGVLFALGIRTTGDYTLSRKIYSSRQFSDTIDHNARLQTGATYDEWRVRVSGSYGSNSNLLVETGRQTHEENYGLAGTISHQLGRRSEVELDLGHSDISANPVAASVIWPGTHYKNWQASGWLRYHHSKELNVAAGVRWAYDAISNTPDITHIAPQIQVNWKPTPKITFTAEAGHDRLTRSAVGGAEYSARFRGTVSYSPVATTTFSAGTSRSFDPSYYTGVAVLNDAWNIDLQQRLLTTLFLSAGLSQRKTKYDSNVTNIFSNRDDRYDSYYVRLSLPVLGNGSVGVFYQRGRNRSSESTYRFDSEQQGAEVSYRF